jgi:16S rRNA (guanine527-N7)-methyltransferase
VLVDLTRTGLNVSRETVDRLEHFHALLQKWSPRINLVAPSTLADARERHIVDSAQVFALAPRDATTWADLGSGGGFPGLVVAILARDLAPDMRVTLIESDQRKCTFLRTVLRECEVAARVITQRIEALDPLATDVLSARALALLPLLLEFAERHLKPGGLALFQKGAQWENEVTEARRQWQFRANPVTSITEQKSVILKIEGVSRV